MTDDSQGFTFIAGKWQEIFDYSTRISSMPLEQKIEELKTLKRRKQDLNEEISGLDVKVIILQSEPDVAEYRATRDQVAMALLNNLKEKEGISYREFIESGESRDSSYLAVILNKMVWLRRANLIDFGDGRHFPNDDDKIKLTERGRTVQYIQEGR